MSSGGIQFSGVGSGLPIQDWIDKLLQVQRSSMDNLYVKKDNLSKTKTDLNSMESTFRSLKTSVEKLTDANLASNFDIFNAKTAKSSDTDIATVSASNTASVQQLTLAVEKIATSTRATSSNFAQTITGTELFTEVANKQGTAGTFSIYVNGQRNELEIAKTDTLEDVIKKINEKFDPTPGDDDYTENDVTAEIIGGKFKINYDHVDVTSIKLGSSSDTSNIFNIMQLSTATAVNNGDGTSSISSLSAINKLNLSGKILGNTANLNVSEAVTAGTFKIGSEEFTIDTNTTLSTLVSNINRNEKAGVIATIDSKTNQLVLTAKNAGKTAISIENGTSNFLTATRLITAGGDSLASQTLGENAKISINGAAAVEVNSNKVTGDISGIPGVTINLKKVTDTGKTINVSVDQNTEQITSAINDFITKFNKMTNDVNAQTASGKSLSSEYSLRTLKNTIRSMVLDRNSTLNEFDNLAAIGISSGAVGKNIKDATNNLVLDKEKLLDALQKNPSEVRALLIGDSANGVTGIMQKLETKLEGVLDPTEGYFQSRDDSVSAMITSNDKSITRGEDRLESYRKYLVKQFAQMDQYISQMQQQSSSIASL